MNADRTPSLAAIIVAGGQGSRMGGVDKPGLELDGATLRDRIAAAARAAGCAPVIVVGREIGGGPVAALAAGLERLGLPARSARLGDAGVEDGGGDDDDDDDEILLLAGDLVRPARIVALLSQPIGDDGDAAVLVDPDGREQWLAGRYRVAALRAALAALGDPADAALRRLVGGLRVRRVPADAAAVADIDTWEDYERAKGDRDG